ncbi:MAG: efflux RND transporter periplasmic adaptor subunit [Bacteroidales bacterium]|nr:efflux RND transporter periplasmic adaptor subunit [Bacteroidales bacterium]MBN2756917.1 efflux RND transporter periplasmic adaptor subunit [Bacteroidales bacterium]
MKKIFSIILLVFLISCGNNDLTQEDIEKQIHNYKNQISEIEDKISKLETELSKKTGEPEESLITVKTDTILKESFEHYVTASASLEAVNSAFISPEINGQIKSINVNEGDYVTQGQLLVSLNADLIDANIKELETDYQLAKTVFEKQEKLWNQQIGSEIQYLEAKNNKESLEGKLKSLYIQRDKSKIKAPISGIVDKINLKVGELAMPGIQIIELVNIANFYVNADVSEKYIGNVKRGEPITVNIPTYQNWEIQTTVHRTSNIIKQANRTFTLQAIISNKDNKLKPNMLATIKFRDYKIENAITVPSIIVKEDFKGKYIYVAEHHSENFTAKKKYIKTTMSNDSKTLIEDGLNEGEMIIVEGYNLIKDGISIKLM